MLGAIAGDIIGSIYEVIPIEPIWYLRKSNERDQTWDIAVA